MKILVFGAGVIGSIYAAKLFDAKHDVVLLARGKRFESIKKYGLVLRDSETRIQTVSYVPTTQSLEPTDFYDLIIVTVRLDQLDSVLPALKSNSFSTLVLFMLNNPDDTEHLKNELKSKQVLLGFPGAGGTYHDDGIDYVLIDAQRTTIGGFDAKASRSLIEIKSLFEISGFKTTISTNMQAWLKTHAIFVTCISASISSENDDSIQLGKNRESVKLMVKSIREGFSACKALGLPISPANLRTIFMFMPEWFSVLYWQNAMQGKLGTLAFAPHARAAKNEMQLLAKKVLALVHSSSVATPTLNSLLSTFIN
jgi:2-dehydropantoate 2-reductase